MSRIKCYDCDGVGTVMLKSVTTDKVQQHTCLRCQRKGTLCAGCRRGTCDCDPQRLHEKPLK